MASSGDRDFLNPGEEKGTSHSSQVPPPHVAGNGGRENPDPGTKTPKQLSTAGQGNISMGPVSVGNNYNVAGGYATGPYSNPYGPDSSYPQYLGGQMEGNSNTTHVVVAQPSNQGPQITLVNDYIFRSIASTILCFYPGILALRASVRQKIAADNRDFARAKAESEKAHKYSTVALEIAFAYIITILVIASYFMPDNDETL